MNVLMGVRPMMGSTGFARGAGFGLFGPIASLLFVLLLAAIVALVVWAILRKPTRAHGTTAAPVADTALAIARERLAKGEIDAEQYLAIASALSGQQPPSPAPQG
jgi:uncharacterized membrane protein